jgi:hypothetical protein
MVSPRFSFSFKESLGNSTPYCSMATGKLQVSVVVQTVLELVEFDNRFSPSSLKTLMKRTNQKAPLVNRHLNKILKRRRVKAVG